MSHGDTSEHAHEHGAAVHMHAHKMATRAITLTPVVNTEKSFIPNIGALFDLNSAKLTAQAKSMIDAELDKVEEGSELTANVKIVGHTDSMGTASYNQGLSERRAKSVAQYLQSHAKITDKDIETSGKGESMPVADNNTLEGRAKNRRIEIFFE
ncbi:MAG: OmpA family protein [Gammaproteobacteria bacterium]|nr:OmpA family protein [Gammaproteobacteria bacterium]